MKAMFDCCGEHGAVCPMKGARVLVLVLGLLGKKNTAKNYDTFLKAMARQLHGKPKNIETLSRHM